MFRHTWFRHTWSLRTVMASLATAMLAILGLAPVASAADQPTYLLKITYDEIIFPDLTDSTPLAGGSSETADIYASLSVRTAAPDGGGPWYRVRNIGKWGASQCSDSAYADLWDGSEPRCPKYVARKLTYTGKYMFADVLMCKSDTYSRCAQGYWKQSNNEVYVRVRPYDDVRVGVHVMDYDTISSDDEVCLGAWHSGVLTESQIRSYDRAVTTTFDGDDGGTCGVRFHAEYIGTV